MKRLIFSLAATAAAFTISSPASAAQFITISGPSGTYGATDVGCAMGVKAPCSFEQSFDFFTPEGYELVSATISSVAQSKLTNIDFTSVTLNGVFFDLLLQNQQVEFGTLLNQALISGGNNTIVVRGKTGGSASYSGVLSFAPGSAVPEPATWAMMLLGFGGIGVSMRRRKNPVLAKVTA